MRVFIFVTSLLLATLCDAQEVKFTPSSVKITSLHGVDDSALLRKAAAFINSELSSDALDPSDTEGLELIESIEWVSNGENFRMVTIQKKAGYPDGGYAGCLAFKEGNGKIIPILLSLVCECPPLQALL